MEVMVVIVVIAVLASVAGPMIGSITDQGREAATKEKLSALRSGMLGLFGDTGRFPRLGRTHKIWWSGPAHCQCDVLSYDPANNMLVTKNVASEITRGGADARFYLTKKYKRNWKGPYMETDPEDFMTDSWGSTIRYVAEMLHNKLYLWSAGADQHFYGGASSDGANAVTPDKFKKALQAVLEGKPTEDPNVEDPDVPLDDIIISIGIKRKLSACANAWWTVDVDGATVGRTSDD